MDSTVCIFAFLFTVILHLSLTWSFPEGQYVSNKLPVHQQLCSRLATSVDELREDPELISRIATALLKAELYEQAGELHEKVGQFQKALDSYRKGQAYARAVELARHAFPNGKL